MMRIHVTKLYNGVVSVRSYYIERAKRRGEIVEIVHEGRRMRVNGETPYQVTAPPQIARARERGLVREGEAYQLYDYPWRPIEEEPSWTQEGLMKKHEAIRKALIAKGIIKPKPRTN